MAIYQTMWLKRATEKKIRPHFCDPLRFHFLFLAMSQHEMTVLFLRMFITLSTTITHLEKQAYCLYSNVAKPIFSEPAWQKFSYLLKIALHHQYNPPRKMVGSSFCPSKNMWLYVGTYAEVIFSLAMRFICSILLGDIFVSQCAYLRLRFRRCGLRSGRQSAFVSTRQCRSRRSSARFEI